MISAFYISRINIAPWLKVQVRNRNNLACKSPINPYKIRRTNKTPERISTICQNILDCFSTAVTRAHSTFALNKSYQRWLRDMQKGARTFTFNRVASYSDVTMCVDLGVVVENNEYLIRCKCRWTRCTPSESSIDFSWRAVHYFHFFTGRCLASNIQGAKMQPSKDDVSFLFLCFSPLLPSPSKQGLWLWKVMNI